MGFAATKAQHLSVVCIVAGIGLLLAMDRPFAKMLGALVVIASIACFHAQHKAKQFIDKRALLPTTEAIFHGIVDDVARQENGNVHARALVTDDKNNAFVLQIILKDAAAALDIDHHQLITIRGIPRGFSKPASPALFNAERFGLVRNVHGSMSISDPKSIILDEKVPSYLYDMRSSFRARIMDALTPHEASLLIALIFGDTDLFSDEQTKSFQEIGAQHLLAVSGLQITMLSAICFFIFLPLLSIWLPRRWFPHAHAIAAMFTILVLFWFVFMAGFSASATRALFMSTILLMRAVFMRNVDVFDALFASALITILVAPTNVLDAGFLLSYAAVLGILLAHRQSAKWRENRSFISSLFITTFIVTAAAFFSTLPILLLTVSNIAAFALLTNFLLVPPASVLQIPAIVLGIFGCLLDQKFLITTAAYFSNAIEILAEAIATIFGCIVSIPGDHFSQLSVALALLVGFFYILKPRRLMLYAVAALVLVATIPQFSTNHLRVVVMPVGQGDASLFVMPSGHTMLVDAGGLAYGKFDPGESIVLPIVERTIGSSVDILAISHPDPDHINGAFALMDKLTIKEIWHSGFASEHPLTKKLEAKAREKNIPVKTARELLGSHFFGATEVQVLAPNTDGRGDYFSELKANDNSMVIRIVHHDVKMLWCGDIEYFGERLLLESPVDISADIIKAPHHGSKTSSQPELINRVKPKFVIYSTGENNRFRFPHQEIVDRYAAFGARAFNTAVHGEIVITVDNKKISFNAFKENS